MFVVYILYSQKIDRFYIGHTSNISDRILRHNSGRSKYTKPGVPWDLVYQEIYNSKSEAYNREMEIKSKKSKQYILQLIQTRL